MNKTEKIIEWLKTADNQLERISILISKKEQELRELKTLQSTVSSSQSELYKILDSWNESMLLAEVLVYEIWPNNKKEFKEDKIVDISKLTEEQRERLIYKGECTLNVGWLNPVSWAGTLYEIKEWL